jgi:hypothetical protein
MYEGLKGLGGDSDEINEQVRKQLANRCRSKRTRNAEFSPEAPTDWQPRTLRDPRSPKEYFTDDSAWNFIADCIEGGCKIEIIELQCPPGKKAYVFKTVGYPPVQAIYVKLQLGSNNVMGRSFHEDRPARLLILETSLIQVEHRKEHDD